MMRVGAARHDGDAVGRLRYDFGDTAGLTPLLRMHRLGHDFVPPTIHAGGLRSHGAAPIGSALVEAGLVTAESVPQKEVFRAAILFAQAEGIGPAPESAHAIAAVIRKAVALLAERRERPILFCLSEHGFLDLAVYDGFVDGAGGSASNALRSD
jgi:tryptophan synthase beta chain